MRKELEVAIIAAAKAAEKILEIYENPASDFGIERKADNSPLTLADKAAHIAICGELEPLGIAILSEEGKSIDYSVRKDWNKLWIVDPLDGTKEFIKKNGEFTVNIALLEDGELTAGVILVPVSSTLYYAENSLGAFKVENIDLSNINIAKIVDNSIKLPYLPKGESYKIVASRSHLSDETLKFVEEAKAIHSSVELVSKGSSLKICLVAEGEADVYPRYAPTMEWDTAAGDAILRAMNMTLIEAESKQPLKYNKENLLNPFFITANEL